MSALHEWEVITTWRHEGHDYTTCRRMLVPGGWVYQYRAYSYVRSVCGPDTVTCDSIAAVFVPGVNP